MTDTAATETFIFPAHLEASAADARRHADAMPEALKDKIREGALVFGIFMDPPDAYAMAGEMLADEAASNGAPEFIQDAARHAARALAVTDLLDFAEQVGAVVKFADPDDN